MKWFGPGKECPYRDELPRTAIPDGIACAHCLEPILRADFGFMVPFIGAPGDSRTHLAFHEECHMRNVAGCVEHQKHQRENGFAGCDSTCRDDPALTPRQAARAAAHYLRFGRALTNN
jgi:hypothetical protein